MVFAGIFLLAGFFMFRPLGTTGGQPERDEPMEAMRHEFAKTHDPKLNIVPRERLTIALKYYEAQERIQATMKTTSGFSSITWTERGPNNIGGRTRAILFDANDATGKTVFAGGVGGGLWKCTDITAATPAWTVVNDQFSNLAVTAVAQHPTSPQTLYFGTGEGWGNGDAIRGNGIWKSTNGGATWTQLSSTNNVGDFAYIQKLLVTSNGNVYAACRGIGSNSGGLQKSSNGGTSWTRVIGSGSSDMNVADIEEASNGDLYATVGIFTTGKILKSTFATHTTNVGNSGNWTDITPTGTWQRVELAVAPGNANQLYALCQGTGYDVSGIYSSTNAGTNWTSRAIPDIYDQGSNSIFTRGQAWYDLMCVVDPLVSTTVYIGGVDMLKSTNSGSTWTQITSWSLYNDPFNLLTPFPWLAAQNVHADIHTMVFKPGTNTAALVACDGGVFYSGNLTTAVGLPDWASKSTNYNVTQYYACAAHPTNPNFYLAGAQDNGSHKFTQANINAVTEVTGGDGAFCFIDKSNGNNQITSYVYNNFFVSTNGGTNFSYASGGNNTGRFINPSDLDGVNDVLYSAGGNDELIIWDDIFSAFGPTRYDEFVNLNGEQISSIKVSPNNPNTVYVGTSNGRVYRVANPLTSATVTNLTATALVSGGYVSSIDVKKRATNTDDSILVAISNYGVNSVYYTSNGTNSSPTWVDIDDNNTLQDIPVRWAVWSPASSKIVFLGTEVGILGTGTLNGNNTNWTILNNGIFPNVRVDMLQFNSSNQLVAATHGRGLWTSNDVSPLELRLLTFNAKAVKEKVLLEWEVNNDKECRRYIVERSYTGDNFEEIKTVVPSGNNRYESFDEFVDTKKPVVYYRLKMEDIKGTISYSGIQTLKWNTPTSPFIEQVYPTVTNGLVNIRIGNTNAKQLMVQVVDQLGKIHLTKSLPYASTAIDLGHLPAGQYLLYITDETGSEKYFSKIVLR